LHLPGARVDTPVVFDDVELQAPTFFESCSVVCTGGSLRQTLPLALGASDGT
jgi:hypothetical protein